MNFDKSKIAPFTEVKEHLVGNGFHEWLEEIFFMVKNHIKRGVCTRN